jgi:hypothetical protein
MKTNLLTYSAVAALLLATRWTFGQGTFAYDQQSSDESYIGSGAASIQSNQPFGQSFTPATSAVNFVRLYLFDSTADASGATIRINLRSGSITGSVLSSTDPLAVPQGFVGTANFLFPANIPLSPGTQYYFQPEVISGGQISVAAYNNFHYAGGNAYSMGVASPGFDLWFREGVYNVPEPSSLALALSGLVFLLLRRRAILH